MIEQFSGEPDCSGLGICVRDTNKDESVCNCFPGFDGDNCSEYVCPGFDGEQYCNGNGSYFIHDLLEFLSSVTG